MAKIIFFSPHSLIWVHAFPEAIVAESLMKSGHDVVYITCGGVLSSACICLRSRGVHPDSPDVMRAQVCHQCKANAKLIKGKMKLPGYSMSMVEEAEDRKQASQIMAGLTSANYSQLELENVPIGKIAAYEFLPGRKKMTTDFSDSEWQQFYSTLNNAIKVFYMFKRVFDKEKPDYVISYNTLYSVNAVVSHLAKEKGVISYSMDTGMNLSNAYQRLYISHDSLLHYIREISRRWPMIKDMPCNQELLSEATEHFLELLRGRSAFVYSAPKAKSSIDVRSNFGILADQKILVATTSCYDESFAAQFVGAWPKPEKLIFKKQADWVQSLIKWVEKKPEYFLIIRVHPREFPNKRESVMSEHAAMLQALLVNLPKNVRVNWPEDGLSLYDLACEVDVFLNAWSSTGQEMSLLGLPVVLYSNELQCYPSGINYLGETESHYFSQIEQALKDGWNFEQVRKTYRWFALLFGRSQVKIDDSYVGPARTVVNRNLIQRKMIGGLRRIFPLLQEWQDCQRRAKYLKHAQVLNQLFATRADVAVDIINTQVGPAPTLEQETAYIKIEMMRIAKALWGGIDNVGDARNGKLFSHFRNCLKGETA